MTKSPWSDEELVKAAQEATPETDVFASIEGGLQEAPFATALQDAIESRFFPGMAKPKGEEKAPFGEHISNMIDRLKHADEIKTAMLAINTQALTEEWHAAALVHASLSTAIVHYQLARRNGTKEGFMELVRMHWDHTSDGLADAEERGLLPPGYERNK